MKKLPILFITLLFISVWQNPAMARTANSGKECSPTNIQYCKKGKTFTGKQYRTYTVRCSDGTKRVISAWNNRKQWCVGEGKKNCTTTQLKAAKKACRS